MREKDRQTERESEERKTYMEWEHAVNIRLFNLYTKQEREVLDIDREEEEEEERERESAKEREIER